MIINEELILLRAMLDSMQVSQFLHNNMVYIKGSKILGATTAIEKKWWMASRSEYIDS